MSSTRTTHTKSWTTNRGRGGGKGRQTKHYASLTQSNTQNEGMDVFHQPCNDRRSTPTQFIRSNRSSNRGLDNFAGSKGDNVRSNRSAPSPNSNSDRIPNHVKSPFFVGTLMSRFSNMVPTPSFLVDEVASKPEVNFSPNSVTDKLDTLKTPNSPKSKNSFIDLRTNDENNRPNGNIKQNLNKKDDRMNNSHDKSHVEHTNKGETQFGQQFLAAQFSDEVRKSGHIRINNADDDRSLNLQNAIVTNSHDKYHNSKQDLNPNTNHKRTAASSSNVRDSVPFKENTLESRIAIMKRNGFNIESQNKISDSRPTEKINEDLNQPLQNSHHGAIASRTTPRVRYNLENKPAPSNIPSPTSEQRVNGFNIESKNKSSDGTENKNEDLNQPPQNSHHSAIASRTAPHARCILGNKPELSTIPSPTLEQRVNVNSEMKHLQNPIIVNAKMYHRPNDVTCGNIKNTDILLGNSSAGNVRCSEKRKSGTETRPLGKLFPSQLDEVRNEASCNERYRSGSENFQNQKFKQNTNKSKPSPKIANKFNPFLKTEQVATPQSNIMKESSSVKQRGHRHENNQHDLLTLNPLPLNHRLTKKDISGRNRLNVQRPARDLNERVPSRGEVLERMQQQYDVQRAGYETKLREKEAKKREEFLKKYKHVDQGFRLNDGLLDEAAGYDPDYYQVETIHDIRERQQDQLRRDALAYQERQREEQERQKKLQEKKSREKLAKSNYLDAGYKLGHGNKQDLSKSRNEDPPPSGHLLGAIPKYSKNIEENQNEQKYKLKPDVKNINVQTPPLLIPDSFDIRGQSPHVVEHNSNVPRNSDTQVSTSTQNPCGSDNPVSCIVKNRNGVVLVLRPTSEALNRALASRLEVQDEMDKLGYSALYKPTPEQEPMLRNNRFERKPGLAPDMPVTGTIPKNTFNSAVKPEAVPVSKVEPNIEPLEQDKPAIDYQTELRAARLKFQQQYELSLKKQKPPL